MRVLLTGSNGFVGKATTRILNSRGMTVVGLGRQKKSNLTDDKMGVDEYIQHDIGKPFPDDLFNLFPSNFDAVVHCAALSSPWDRPSNFMHANVNGTQNVFDFCVKNKIPHLIYISSSSVFYTNHDQLNITEETPKPPLDQQINVYSRTKLMGEHIIENYPGTWAILRPRAVFGPGDTVVFPRILRLAESGKFPHFVRSDKQQVMCDLTYVDVLADYIALTIEKKFQGDLNITNNEPVIMYEFLDQIFKRLGLNPKKKTVGIRTALFVAQIAEIISALFFKYKEPPLTRYGVSVFAYSKTFDVTKCVKHLGKPCLTLGDGLDRFISWWTSSTGL